jgi:hypothetical protein
MMHPPQETLTADAIENFLREKQMPLRIENGGICSVLLFEMIAKSREVRKLHPIPSEASQARDKLLPVSLAWLYCVDA